MFAASKSGSAEAKDPQFNYVTMLLHGNGTNGAQNNTFTDSSTNNFTITRNGNTTQGTFSPYGSNWSNYFDGSAAYLTTSSSAISYASDFTVECWFNTTTTTTYACIYSDEGTTTGGTILLNNATNNGQITVYIGSSVLNFTSTTTGLNNGKWNHVALSRSGTTLRLFINGVLENTTTVSGTITSSSTFRIANSFFGGRLFNGYISNFRVTNTAVYTSAFTPSTTPLTAISGTSLLTCQSNRFIDNSSNNFTMTVAGGSPSVQRFSPFKATSAYTTSVIGGSGYFDGSGDYLTTPQNAAFNIGTGQFTVEAWVYWNGTTIGAGGYGIISLGNGANGGSPVTYVGWTIQINFDTGGKPTWYRYDGTEYSYASSVNLPSNQWVHLAVSRNSSNTLSFWMNGVRVYTGTVTTSFNNVNSDPLNIGYRFDGGGGGSVKYFPGYISNARVVVGTDVYGAANSTITVPTSPLTAVTNTAFLLSTTNAGILDNAMMNDLETVGNAQISTSVKKYGTGSLAFDGSGDWLTTLTNPNLVLGSGDFTVECWIYTGTTGSRSGIIGNRTYPSPDGGDTVWCIALNPTNIGGFGYIYFHTDATPVLGSSTNFSANTWFHFALTRSGTTFRMFLDGTQVGSTTSSINLSSSATIYVGKEGARSDQSAPLNGYIDDLRITKGYARYTANFTAPTAAFPDKG